MKINTQNTCHKPVDYDPFCGGDILLTVPSTEAQKEIWVSVQMGGDGANCAFNESVSLKLSGRLDVETLRSSFQSVVQRHESLRATFTPDGETLCINASLPLEIPLVDLTGMGKQLRDERLSDILHQEVQLPFNLEHGPLIRGQIVKVNEREFFFIITAHHIICDGWSSAVLLKELGVIYSAIKQGVKADLKKPYQFSDYALLLESQAQSSEYSADEDYWLRKFQEKIPVLDLPADRNRPPLRSYNAAREDRKLDRTLVVNLKNTGAKAGCTFFITLLAGLKVFLYRLSGHKDLVVGFPAAAQSIVGQDTLVGHCVNTLPIRSNINGKQ
ncbi:MAG: condensation domain-containing protein, partial [Planctomycetota bacterium]